MKSLWTTISSKIGNDDISRDFKHLSQAMGSSNESVKYELAVILEKCEKNPDYKDTAIKNLIPLAKDDHRLKEDLHFFSCNKDPEYKDVKPIAEEILEKMKDKPECCF